MSQLKMPIDPAWYMRMADEEGDYEVGAGFESMTPEGAGRFLSMFVSTDAAILVRDALEGLEVE